MGSLIDTLQSMKGVKHLFERSISDVMHPTSFAVFDFYNGFIKKIYGEDGTVLRTEPAIGIAAGSFNTIIGKPSTAKTTFAIRIGADIVKPYENGLVLHFDTERALQETRAITVSNLDPLLFKRIYQIKTEDLYIEDIYDTVIAICNAKDALHDEIKINYNTTTEFNEPIITYPPTVIIIDSIPTLATKDSKSEMEGGTYSNRVAKAIAQFYKRLTPIIKKYNITIIAINHINAKLDINAFSKTQPQLLYLKMDESVPGGNAPLYLASNIFKFEAIGSEKFTLENDGFDGFAVRVSLLKSRTNINGSSFILIYDKVIGFDPLRSLLRFASDLELIEGRNPKRYIKDYKDEYFSMKTPHESFNTSETLREKLTATVYPYLYNILATGDKKCDSQNEFDTMLNILENLN